MPAIVRSVLAVVAGYAAMASVVIALSEILRRVASDWMGDEGDPNPTYLSILSAVQMGGRQPRWYQMVLAFFATIGTVLGGLLRARG